MVEEYVAMGLHSSDTTCSLAVEDVRLSTL